VREWGKAVGVVGEGLGPFLALFRSLPPSVSLELVSSDAGRTAVRREAFAIAPCIGGRACPVWTPE
jgi:hypothetical protein